MFVWATWCRRKAMCRRCNSYIVTGDKMIKCQYYVKRRRFTMYFHFNCWIANAEDWFTTHPYQKRAATSNGRPRMPIDDELRKKRLKLQRDKAKAVQDKKKAAAKLPAKKAQIRFNLLVERIASFDAELMLIDKEIEDAKAKSL